MRRLALFIALVTGLCACNQTRLDTGWKFAFGDASDPAADFGSGTEYFNYLTKAHSIHNEGPYSLQFDDSAWQDVTIPHDWVASLPYDREASHSHGYKTVGWKYPKTSVGWYRLKMDFSGKSRQKSYALRFDGIFRNATVWFNGFYMGTEPSGYAVQLYDITPYIDWEGENLVCVRADASLEEGWFYEGAGIYRNVWLMETGKVHPAPGGIWTHWDGRELEVFVELEGPSGEPMPESALLTLFDAEGETVWEHPIRMDEKSFRTPVGNPHLWSPEDPYLYVLQTRIGEEEYYTTVGLRTAEFNASEGFLLNGKKVTLKGVNLHQDHAGVGAALPDGLIEWRVKELKKYGVNAIRCSHNPASPALLDICDSLGVMLIDENRLMGVNAEHKRLLENMVRAGRNHPSVILWSIGNEEWGLENDIRGRQIARQMQDFVHQLDPFRQTTVANAGGGVMFQEADVKGYNYIIQNNVAERHASHPEWMAYGSEETTGCGTRGVYFPQPGHMVSINRTGEYENVIERGWKYYHENTWTGGVFWWTGFDYRGEPNPLQYPAHDSEFGLLDYCGFPKDEAFYLKAWWTDEPVLHVFPHWNLAGHEGETVDLWVYSNCDEVRLTVNGKRLEKKAMPRDGHLSWKAVYKPGKVVAEGFKGGKRVLREVVETTGEAVQAELETTVCKGIQIVNVTLKDKKGRFVPDACPTLTFTLDGPGTILGAGNGDPACPVIDNPGTNECRSFTFPAFNGHAQLLVRGEGTVTVSF